MCITVSWTMYSHGNNPPVTVYIYYKEGNETDWTLSGNQTTSTNNKQMDEDICDLKSNTSYDIRIQAVNTRETGANSTEAVIAGRTRGKLGFILFV